MSPVFFRIDHRDLTDTLVAQLASLEEQYPSDIVVTDYIEVACQTTRTAAVLNALMNTPQQEPDRSYVVSEQDTDRESPIDAEDPLLEARLHEVACDHATKNA